MQLASHSLPAHVIDYAYRKPILLPGLPVWPSSTFWLHLVRCYFRKFFQSIHTISVRDVSTSATVCTSRGVILSRRLDSNQHHRLERGKSCVCTKRGCTFLITLAPIRRPRLKKVKGHHHVIDACVQIQRPPLFLRRYCTLVPPGKEGDEVLQPGLEPELSALKGRRLSQFVYSRKYDSRPDSNRYFRANPRRHWHLAHMNLNAARC